MNLKLLETIGKLSIEDITEDRKLILNPLIQFVVSRSEMGLPIKLNFICTHNSRRSHLSQIWAQVMADYFDISNVVCYSGGTEATAIYQMVVQTLGGQGLEMIKLSDNDNPIYAVDYNKSSSPLIAFSKKYDHTLNPKNGFAAIMTCNHADENCPLILGADKRIPITYIDPKVSDGTPDQVATYLERSEQIATEMKFIF